MPIARKLFFSHLMAVVLVSGSIGTYFYFSAYDSLMSNLQHRLQTTASIISQTIETETIADIRNEADAQTKAYQTCLKKLRNFKNANKDIAFIYVMRLDQGRVYFVIDSDESDEQTHPGQRYYEVVPSLMHGFHKPAVDAQITTDQWGSFLSGYAPLPDGNSRYLVGIDMYADDVAAKFRRLKISGITSLFASLILAMLFSRMLTRSILRHIHVFIDRCDAITRGKYSEKLDLKTGDELEHLVDAFNEMSDELSELQRRNNEVAHDLREAKNELANRVEASSDELDQNRDKLKKALNTVHTLGGLMPICSSCKKIRNDEGYWTQVEEFMMEHSHAQFSHGICPACLQKLYPEYIEDTDN